MTIDDRELARVNETLKTIPVFAGMALDMARIRRLGGMTNLVYQVQLGSDEFVLRLPGAGTEAYIDREVEAHNARVAAEAGVSAALVYVDPARGVMVTALLGGCVTMTADQFRRRAGAPARGARILRRLHRSGRTFRFRFELFAMIDNYLKTLARLGATLPDGYREVVADAAAVRAALDQHPAALAPCHCDPLAENFLDDGARMWLVDWEYSGMNDPIWDLGDMSVEAGFDAMQDAEMLRAYCDGEPSADLHGRMVAYKAMCDLLWTLWGLIQHANGNQAEDFWAYATGRFERCKALMGDADFAVHLRAIRNG